MLEDLGFLIFHGSVVAAGVWFCNRVIINIRTGLRSTPRVILEANGVTSVLVLLLIGSACLGWVGLVALLFVEPSLSKSWVTYVVWLMAGIVVWHLVKVSRWLRYSLVADQGGVRYLTRYISWYRVERLARNPLGLTLTYRQGGRFERAFPRGRIWLPIWAVRLPPDTVEALEALRIGATPAANQVQGRDPKGTNGQNPHDS